MAGEPRSSRPAEPAAGDLQQSGNSGASMGASLSGQCHSGKTGADWRCLAPSPSSQAAQGVEDAKVLLCLGLFRVPASALPQPMHPSIIQKAARRIEDMAAATGASPPGRNEMFKMANNSGASPTPNS